MRIKELRNSRRACGGVVASGKAMFQGRVIFSPGMRIFPPAPESGARTPQPSRTRTADGRKTEAKEKGRKGEKEELRPRLGAGAAARRCACLQPPEPAATGLKMLDHAGRFEMFQRGDRDRERLGPIAPGNPPLMNAFRRILGIRPGGQILSDCRRRGKNEIVIHTGYMKPHNDIAKRLPVAMLRIKRDSESRYRTASRSADQSAVSALDSDGDCDRPCLRASLPKALRSCPASRAARVMLPSVRCKRSLT